MPMVEYRYSVPDRENPNRRVIMIIRGGGGAFSLPVEIPPETHPETGAVMYGTVHDYWLCEVELVLDEGDRYFRIRPSVIGLVEFEPYFGHLHPFIADFVPWDVIWELQQALHNWPERQRKHQLHQELVNQINNLLIALPLGIHNQLLAPIPIMLNQVAAARS